jgi:anti-anti-sigma regulatory factor
MAKRPHRVFEMYDFRDEALHALAPKSADRLPAAASVAVEESWTFEHLNVSHAQHAMVVEFRAPQAFEAEHIAELRQDFSHLASKVDAESKILLDFTGVKSFPAELVAMLAQFYQNLRHKGARLLLCCLGAETREAFFPVRSP